MKIRHSLVKGSLFLATIGTSQTAFAGQFDYLGGVFSMDSNFCPRGA